MSSLQEQIDMLQIQQQQQQQQFREETRSALKQMAQGNMDLSINQTFSETYHEQQTKGGREVLIRPGEYKNISGLEKWKNVWAKIEVCPSLVCVCGVCGLHIFQKRAKNPRHHSKRSFKNSYPLP